MSYPENWTKKIQPFAEAVGKTIEEITAALKSEVGDPGDQALEALGNEEYSPFESIKTALSGLSIPSAILRKNIGLLRVKKEVVVSTSDVVRVTILPAVPDDVSFIESLKTQGDLKVGMVEIVSAVRAALAKREGLYDVPDKVTEMMETTAECLEQPVGPEFYEVRNLVVRRSYADIMDALNIKGKFVTDQRKNAFLSKLETSLWPEIAGFHRRLVDWNKVWMDTANNAAGIVNAITSVVHGTPSAMIQQAPNTLPLRTAAETAINTINKVFAGFGIPISRALAYEAIEIKNILDNTKLPPLVGALNKEQMLKLLGINVTSDQVNLERSLVQYVVAIMEYPKTEGGQKELYYLSEMLQLGISIDFDRLVNKSSPIRKPGHNPY